MIRLAFLGFRFWKVEADSMTLASPLLATTICWVARILGGVIVIFWGVFMVAHLVGDAGGSSRPMTWQDYAIVATLVSSLVGLGLAWKWEGIGAAIALVAVGVCAALNWRVLTFPGTLIPITALLFASTWWIRQQLEVKVQDQ